MNVIPAEYHQRRDPALQRAEQLDPGVANANRDDMSLRNYLSPIFSGSCAHARHLAVAVSGGADSMALALLARDWCDTHQVRLSALTVDHGLRKESAHEAKQVAAWMHGRGIDHQLFTPPADDSISNLQSRARHMRYESMVGWCHANDVPVLLVAHHADDQAETVALQQHRGESPPSRAGMALVAEREGIQLVRPLLGVRKQALVDYLQACAQPWISDPSNESDAYARNRLRKTLDEETTLALWHEAQQQGEKRHGDDLARNAWLLEHAHMTEDDVALDTRAWRMLPTAMRSDVLSRAVQAVGGKKFRPRHHDTKRLDQRLQKELKGKATLGHCIIAWDARDIHIHPEPHAHDALDNDGNTPHITRSKPLKQLASAPFWWFNHALFS